MNNLLTHSGSRPATLAQIKKTKTPEGTDTHTPVPHIALINLACDKLDQHGFQVTAREFALRNNDSHMFAVITAKNGKSHDDYEMALGLRNSHDKSFAAGAAVGSHVFVCDNMAFSSEIVIARKHTPRIMEDLPGLVEAAILKIAPARDFQDERIAAYKKTEIDDRVAHDLMIRSAHIEENVINHRTISKVLEDWRNPRHEEFSPRTIWSLFNCYTEQFKGTHPEFLPRQTQRLHNLMDSACRDFGVELASPNFEEAIDE